MGKKSNWDNKVTTTEEKKRGNFWLATGELFTEREHAVSSSTSQLHVYFSSLLLRHWNKLRVQFRETFAFGYEPVGHNCFLSHVTNHPPQAEGVQYNTIQYNSNTIRYNTILYYTILHNTKQYNTILYKSQYNTIRHNTILIQYDTILYYTILHNTIQYNTIQYYTILYNSQYNTIQF